MSIQEIQNEIIEEFATFDDWMDKYAYLIELGGDLQPMPEAYQKDTKKKKTSSKAVNQESGYKLITKTD